MVDLNDDSINLRALKKIDDSIREIVLSGGQTGVYYYDINQDTWARRNIEGALFFVRRSTQPEFAFVVINRLNTVNFVQKITKDFALKVQGPYLLYKNNENEIYCIWFYDQENCNALYEKINSITNQMNKKNQLGSLDSPLSHNDQQLNGFGTQKQPNSAGNELLKNLLSHNNNQLNRDPIVLNQSASKQSPLPSTNDPNDLVKPIPQRRSVNLKDLFETSLVINEGTTNSSKDHQVDQSVQAQHELLSFPSMSEPKKYYPIVPPPTLPNLPPSYSQINSTMPNSYGHNSEAICEDLEEENKIPMNKMSLDSLPMGLPMFDSALDTPLPSKNLSSAMVKNVMNATKIMPNSSSNNRNSITENPSYLTMEQLKKTLIHLLKNDADFLHTIHTTYVECIKK